MNVQQTVPLLYVADIEASRDFYCDGLGFKTAEAWAPGDKLAWCWLTLEGAALMLQQAEPADLSDHKRNVVFYFLCNDADSVHAALKQRGVEVSDPSDESYGMRQVFLRDPDGYSLCFEHRLST